ncbi:MAG: phenylalanine--tRNA ligase subunit beta [Nannocystaceae bacterium]
MQISWQWLRSLVELPSAEAEALDPQRLADLLTSVGLEVDGVEHHGAGVELVVVGEIRSKAIHPQADRLTLVEIFDGVEVVPVVCGAQNLPEVGGKVAFAPVGASLPNGMEIAAREVRGQLSRGMICSEEELDIGGDGAGILVLPADWEAGARLVDKVPEIVDAVLEIGVTPNRPDALGHVGVARDVAVKLGGELRQPALRQPEVPEEASLVTLDAGDRCGRYFGYVLDGVTVGPSPLWMRVRLHRLGLRAINNCVDITNFVLMEQGQPLHAFDRARLAEGRVVIRMAAAKEAFHALDGSEHALTPEDLVIADAAIPQALAGVMGGAKSMVHAGTDTILLEAAWFHPAGIRASSKRHAISSDSSYRFERGVDHGAGLERAALRAIELFGALAGATCRARAESVGERPPRPRIDLRLGRVHHLLGMPVGADESARILDGLGVEVAREPVGVWRCVAPTHRPDLTREVDLIEELMRFHGLEDLPAEASVPSAPIVERAHPRAKIRARLTDALAEAGLHEHRAYAFTHPDKLRPFFTEADADKRLVRLANPLRVPLSVMRTALLPDLLDALESNVARHPHPVRLFSVGRTYAWASADPNGAPRLDPRRAAPAAVIDALLPVEREQAAILLHGGEAEDARSAVGVMIHALERTGYAARAAAIAPDARIPYLHPGVQAAIAVDGAVVGHVGELHPDIVAGRDLQERGRVYVGVIDVEALPPIPVPVARERPRFPATSRDLSLDLPIAVPAAAVIDALGVAAAAQAPGGEDPAALVGDGIAEAVEVVEDYRGEGVEDGRRALLLRLHYRAEGRSVTDGEVQGLHDAIVAGACEALRGPGVEIRIR